jgi:hypothetical protein
MQLKNVLITTAKRGVWFAQVDPEKDLTPRTLTDLKNCRMAIRWRTQYGLQELCKEGPNENTLVGMPSNIEVLHEVTGVFAVTDKAAEKWMLRHS